MLEIGRDIDEERLLIFKEICRCYYYSGTINRGIIERERERESGLIIVDVCSAGHLESWIEVFDEV